MEAETTKTNIADLHLKAAKAAMMVQECNKLKECPPDFREQLIKEYCDVLFDIIRASIGEIEF